MSQNDVAKDTRDDIELGDVEEENPLIPKDVTDQPPPVQEPSLMGFNKNAVFAVSFYWVTSLSLVFLNKTIMDGDVTHVDAPLFMSWTQFVVTVLCCAVLGELGKKFKSLSRFPPFEYDTQVARNVLPLTGVFLGMIIFNNLCLKYVQVSFYQVARSLTILFNVAFSFVFLGSKTNLPALGCCLGICVGYLLGCNEEIEFSWPGVIFGGLSSIFVALYSIFVKKVSPFVNNSSEKLMIYNNVNACIVLVPIIFFFTEERFVLSMNLWAFKTPVLWVFILVGGVFGFLINFASFIQIHYTSPLSHNVSGTAKAAAQTLIAVLFLGNTVTAKGMMGIAMVLAFSFAYARTK